MSWAVVWMLSGVACVAIARAQGRSQLAWLLLGWVFGPFAVAFAVWLGPAAPKAPAYVSRPWPSEAPGFARKLPPPSPEVQAMLDRVSEKGWRIEGETDKWRVISPTGFTYTCYDTEALLGRLREQGLI